MATRFDLDQKKQEIQKNNDLMAQEDFWNDQKKAQKIIKENNSLKDLVDQHTKLYETTLDLLASVTELQSSLDEDMSNMIKIMHYLRFVFCYLALMMTTMRF